ncbi:MAG: endonuclease/exonuclease/phosphatase family protein [Clostridia bacterium]|nr:endonuclease/exonuclease/phosphatase family protein [Clostridia bacterium]
MSAIKVMSFNMRTQSEADGENQFRARKERIMSMLDREAPDIIGFQEVTDEMRLWLREALGGRYTVVGCGRQSDYTGESVAVALRNGAFELISLTPLWLSETPDIPGSRYEDAEQSKWPRLSVVATVKHYDGNEPFYVINTHLDHLGARARYMGMKQNAEFISGIDKNYVYTGDMNATPDTEEIKVLAAVVGADKCVDATAELGGTFHGFGRLDDKVKIDYIFTNGRSTGAYAVPDDGADGLYYSDHHAVCAMIEF